MASGFLVTLAHRHFDLGEKDPLLVYLLLTVLLGVVFLGLQYTEYYYGEFTLRDSVFGGVFYMTTGLHALHVMVGVVFLAFTLVGVYKDLFSTETIRR